MTGRILIRIGNVLIGIIIAAESQLLSNGQFGSDIGILVFIVVNNFLISGGVAIYFFGNTPERVPRLDSIGTGIGGQITSVVII